MTKLEDYSVNELEEMSVYIYSNNRKYSPENMSDVLRNILSERQHKINNAFVWSEENKQKFLKVNNELTRVFQCGYDEAIALAQKLEYRMCNEDPFIKDYEVELKITPYIREENTDADGFSFINVLCEPFDKYSLPICINISHVSKDIPVFLDKSSNWNIGRLKGIFTDDVYIGYSIHSLTADDVWSFQDIININKICADVKVWHQYFTNI